MLKKVFLSILLLISFIHPAGTDPLLLKIRKKIESISPFKVNFINRVISGSSVDIEEKGVMIFRDSEMIKWEYLEPDHKIWILSGDTYEYYDKEDQQITRGQLEKKTQLWIFQILFQNENNTNLTVNRDSREIRFLNAEEGADFRIFISDKFLPVKVIQKDPTGVDIVYLFNEFIPNIKLSADEFKLKIEGEVDIIELE